MTLPDFLLARIAEDEAVAREYASLTRTEARWKLDVEFDREWGEPVAIDIDPARVLAECEAKRQIVGECQEAIQESEVMPYGGSSGLGLAVLQSLAAVYADHPDYDEAWRP